MVSSMVSYRPVGKQFKTVFVVIVKCRFAFSFFILQIMKFSVIKIQMFDVVYFTLLDINRAYIFLDKPLTMTLLNFSSFNFSHSYTVQFI